MKQVLLTLGMVLTMLLVSFGVDAKVLLTEDFQTTSGSSFPDGWMRRDSVLGTTSTTSLSSYLWKTNTGGFYDSDLGETSTGQRCAYLYVYPSYVKGDVLFTPQITLSALRDVKLKFKLKNSTYAGNMNIYVSTDNGATYRQNVLATGIATGSTWTDYEFSLAAFKPTEEGQTVQIRVAFEGCAQATGTSAIYYYLDNVVFEEMQSCQIPEGLYYSNITSNGAYLNWVLNSSEGDPTQIFDYQVVNLSNRADSIEVDSVWCPYNYVQLQNLNIGTNYIFRVRSNCGANHRGYSDWVEFPFSTLSPAQNPPYHNTFDNSSALPAATFSSNVELSTNPAYAFSGNNALKFNTTAANAAHMIFPLLNINANDIEMEFKIRANVGTYRVKYHVGFQSDPSDPSTFIPFLSDSTNSTSYKTVRFNTSTVNDNTTPTMMAIYVEAGYSTSVYVDNVKIHNIPSCTRPEQVTLTGLGDTFAAFDWAMTNASEVDIIALNLTDSTTTVKTATTHPFTFTGLTGQTDYEFYFVGKCSATDLSDTTDAFKVRTLCSPLQNPVFIENFDNTTTALTAPDCWTMDWLNYIDATGKKNAPFGTLTTYKHSGSRAMALQDQPNGTISYLATPGLNLDSVGKYNVRLWVYRLTGTASKTKEGIQIWVTSIPGDTTTGTKIAYIHRYASLAPVENLSSSAWCEYEYNIPAGGIQYITIVGISEYGAATYFDDFEIRLAPSCPRVNDIAMTGLTSTSATMSWTPGGNEPQWVVDYTIRHNGAVVIDTVEVTNTPQLTVNGLEPNTAYTVDGNVRSFCAVGDTGEIVTFAFSGTTPCLPLTQLPYNCGFEDNEITTAGSYPMPGCWARFNDATSASYNYYPYANNASTTYPSHSGSKMLYQYQYYSTSYGANPTAVLPGVDTQVYPINTLRVKFWAMQKYASSATYCDGFIEVGVMSNPSDINTFVVVDTVNLGQYVASYNEIIVNFDSYNGTGNYVALRFPRPTSKYNYICVDDLTLEEIPNCGDIVGDFTLSNATTNSVRVAISDSTATSWQIRYYNDLSDDTVTVNGTLVYDLPNLLDGTQYSFTVRRVCGSEYGAWKLPKNYATLAVPANAPYFCGFETAAERNGWNFVHDATVNDFVIGSNTDAVHTGTKALYITNDGGDTYEYTLSSTKGTQYAYRPIHFSAAGYQISYNWKCHGESYYDFGKFMICPISEELAVGAGGTYNTAKGDFPDTLFDLNPSYVNGANVYPLLNCSTSVNGDNWNSYSRFVDFTNCPGDYNIVIAWNKDGSGGAQPPISIDDIVIEEITCIPPSNVSVDGLGSDTASLIFSPAVAGKWEVYVDTVEFTLDNMVANPFRREVVSNPVYEMGNLTQNTEYFYTVRSICGAGDTSFWKPVASFRTYCSALSIPYNEDFETESSAACWSMISQQTAGSVGRSTAQHQTGTGSLQIVTATAVSPEFVVDSLIDCMISGYVYSTADSAVISVGAIADPNDVTTFVPCAQITVLNKNTWTEFVSYFNVLAEEDDEFKYAKNIAFAAPENTVFFDKIVVDHVAACPKPSEPNFTLTDTSFTLSFTEAGSATQWALYVNGRKQIINQNPVTVTGLNSHSNYAIQIASICGAGDTSDIADFGTITTNCGKVETPYVCSFESSEGFVPASSAAATESTFYPACWDVVGYKAGGTYPYAYVSTSSTYTHTGSAGVYMYSTSAYANMLALVMPEMADPINTLSVKFWYKNSSTTSTYYRLQAGYMNDPTDVNSFVPVYDCLLTTTWTEVSCKFDTVQHAVPGARIAFRFAGGSATASAYLDDISVKVLRNCSDPEAPVYTNLTGSSVAVTFTDTCAAHTNYEYIYGEYGFDKKTAIPVAITGKTFNLTGLTDDTEYEVAVRAVCGVGDESNWVSSSFHTLCYPYVITEENPYVNDFEDAPRSSSAKYDNICFTQQGDSTTSSTYYGIKGYTPNGSTTYSHGGDMCLYMYSYKTYQPDGCYMSRQFHLDADKMYKVSIYARATSYVTRFRVLYGTQDVIANMTAVIDADVVNCTATNSTFADCWQEYVGYIMPETTGDYYIGLKSDYTGTNTYSYLFVDDWTITAFEGCKPVTASVVEDSATQSSVSIQLSDSLTTGEWQYAIADAEADIQNPVTVTTNPFTISGLTHSTMYTVWVRKVCGEGNASPWTSVQASTACGVITTFPYHEGFEDSGLDLPNCWTTYGDKGTSTSTTVPEWYLVSTTATSTYRHDGTHYIRMRGAAGMTASLVSPQMTFDANREYSIDYYAYQAASTSTYTDNYKVYLSADPTTIVGATFIGETIYKGTSSSAGNKRFTFDFMVPVTGNYYIIFFGDYGNYGYTYLDDITVDMYPVCRTPQTAPVVNSTTMTTMNVSIEMKGHDEAQIGYIPTATGVTVADINTFVNTTTGNAVITGLTGATNYMVAYRYLCEGNDTSDWSPLGYGLTTESDCFEPQNFRTVGIIDAHNAMATWGRAPQALGYEYQLVKNAVVVDSGFVTADTIRFNNLVPVTVYTLRVRGICSGDTTNWEQIQFQTTRESANIPYVCDFESLNDDALWDIVNYTAGNNRFFIGGNASGVTGRAMYVSDNYSTNTYSGALDNSTASVLLNMTAGNYLVQFDWMCKGESSYDYSYAYILPVSTALSATSCTSIPAGAINLTDGARMNLNESMKNMSKIVTIPSDNVYQLVFTWHNDGSTYNAPSMTVDNIRVDVIECMPLESMELLGVNPTSASVALKRYSNETTVEYGIATVNDIDSVAQIITLPAGSVRDTLRFSNLNTNTNYYVFAREVCDSAHAAPWMVTAFKTLHASQMTPYICSFENGEDLSKWIITSNQTNKFVIGSAAHTRGSKALYISNTNGTTHHYDSTSLSVTFAYIPLTFGPGKYDISYDWIANGESTYDYAHVILMPGNFEPEDGTLPSGMAAATIPAGAISLEAGVQKLNLSGAWQNAYNEVEFADSTTLNLLIAWRNDASGGAQPPFAIDNIYVTPQGNCPPIALSNVSVDSLAEDAFRLIVKNPNQGASTNVVISTTPSLNDTVADITLNNGDSVIFINNLNPHTYYYYGLTSLCSAEETSHTMIGSVRTLCEAITQYPYAEGFEGYKASDKTVLANNCYEVINENPSTAYMYPTTTSSYVHGGAQGLYVYNASTAATAHQTLILPNMTNLNGKTLTFWHKAYNATTSGYCEMSYGYVTASGTYENIKTFTRVTDWREHKDTLSNIPNGARIAFKFDGTYYYYMDDIRINDEVMGNTYNDTICFQSAYNRHGFDFQAGRLAPGDTTFTALILANELGQADSLTTANIHMLHEIYSMTVDTICEGADYTNGDWVITADNIANGNIYYHTFQSHLGCDSSVAMTLYLQPTHEFRYDTICQGDVCTMAPFDTMMLTQTGAYDAYVPTKFGCIDTLTLRLLVTDSFQVTNATICEGFPYTWEDFGTFSQAGVYRRAVTGLGGCPVMKELHLSVYPADSICNVTFCKGGFVQVADTIIYNAGSYELHRINLGGCDITYHITATEGPAISADVYDVACEGHEYFGYGISGLTVTGDTVITVSTKTADALCDSVTNVHLTYVATKYGSETVTINKGETYEWYDNTYSETGTYTETLQSAEGCDSVVTLHLSVIDGVEVVNGVKVDVVPNPVRPGMTAYVYGEFGDVEAVEILNNFGQVVDRFAPSTYPIEVQGLEVEGLYYVRVITREGEIYTEKLLVK